MPEMEDRIPARPMLALRLGITGARNLRTDQLNRIREHLKDVFALVKADMERLASLKEVAHAYAPGPGGMPLPRITLITPIALGADRLAAREALAQGCEIFVPMPFPQKEYEEDFTGIKDQSPDTEPISAEQDLAEFRQLISHTSGQLELDGARSSGPGDDHSSGQAYEAVGRFVVRHCDLLIAVWDGKPSNGRGGTAEIVHYAATMGVPIWWIHAQKVTGPEWLADIQDIQYPVPSLPEALPAEAKLQNYLQRLIPPRATLLQHHGSWIEHLVSCFKEKDDSPLEAYFREVPCPRRFIWKTYTTVMNWAGRTVEDSRPAVVPTDPCARYWFTRYAIADGRANDYAARYRSSYMLTIVLTAMVLILGVSALWVGFSGSTVTQLFSLAMAVCELVALVLILALVIASFHLQWHRKSIEYRLVAELFRKQETLAALGWALSVGKVERLVDIEQLSWLAWLFAANQRCAPFPDGTVAGKESGRGILFKLIDEQLVYHRKRETTALNASRTFEKLSSFAFIAVVIFVSLKVLTELFRQDQHGLAINFGLIAIVLAGFSAAFVAIRNYSELQLLAEQSHHMILELQSARIRVSRLDTSRPLVSQALGAQAANVATLMLQDLDGWGRLFRGKLMEAS